MSFAWRERSRGDTIPQIVTGEFRRFYSNLIGGIKLLVPEKDVEAATNLLDEGSPDKFNVEGVGEYEQPRRPNYNSIDISFNGLDKPLTLVRCS